MPISNTGVNIRFDVDARSAMAQMAALESRLTRLHNAMARQAGTAMFNTTGFEVRLNSQIRSMDELTRSIQRGKLGYRDYMETIRGTNGLLEYQQRLHRANITSMRQLRNGQMVVGLDTRQIGATNSALASQAVQLATAAAASRAYGNSLMNLGKNMAFMGRQAMLSVSAPLALIAGGSAAVFYQLDKQLTQIVKLAGDSSSAMQASSEDIRRASMELATDISQNFGVAIKESLSLQAEFAALGKSGQDLKDATESTARLMRLGDLDSDTAIKFSNTMQQVFGATNEELQKHINLINEVENTTVLTMQDAADAMPKIGPVVKAMGGDIKTALVLLEALKRGGIDAVEAANSIKSVSTSLLRPTVKLEKLFKDMTGQDLRDVIARNNLDMVKITKELGEITSTWSRADKFRLFGQIAGKEQVARFLQLSESLANGQTNIMSAIGKSEQELQAIADQEIKDLMSSASAQFDVQVQRAIAMAYQIGAKVLPPLTKVFSMFLTVIEKTAAGIGGFLDVLGPIGTMLKYVGAAGIAAAAAFGPLLLLMSSAGLIGGGLMKGLGWVTGFRARVANMRAGNGFTAPRMLTAQQAAEQRALDAQQAQQRESILTTRQLEAAIRQLTAAYTGMTAAANGATAATGRQATSQVAAAGRAATFAASQNPTGLFNPNARPNSPLPRTPENRASLARLNSQLPIVGSTGGVSGRTYDSGSVTAARMAAEAERASAAAAKMSMAIGGAAIAVGLLGSQMAGTNKNAQVFVTGLTVALLTLSMFPGAAMAAVAKLKLFGSAMIALAATSSATGGRIVNNFKNIGATIAANATRIGVWGVALAAVAATGYAIYRTLTADARKFREENDRITNSIEGWSKLLEFEKLEPGQKRTESGEAVDTMQSLILRAKEDEHLSALIDRLRREGRNIEELREELYSQAVLLAQQGLKPEQIRQAIDVALSAANIAPEIKKELLIVFENFDVAGPDGQPLDVAARNKISDIFESREGMTASFWQQSLPEDISDFWKLGGGDTVDEDSLSQKAKQEINDVMNNMIQSLEAVSSDPAKFAKVFKNWTDGFNSELEKALNGLKPQAQQRIRDVGLLSVDLGEMLSSGEINDDQYDKLIYQQNVLIEVMDRVKERFGDAGDKFDFMFKNMADASVMAAVQMGKAIMSPTQAADAFKAKIASMGDEWTNLDAATKASLINYYRAAAGLEVLTVEQVNAAMAAGHLGQDIVDLGDKAGQAVPEVQELEESMIDKEVDWELNFQINAGALGMPGDPSEMLEMTLGGYRDAMKKIQDDMFQAAADNAQDNFDRRIAQLKSEQDAAMAALDAESKAMDDRYEAEEKALTKSQEAEKKQFDKSWEERIKAEKAVYDERVKAIEDAQEAEDELERQRQRNAEREAARIRWLASMMNANIDMNVAIASGDLDEASRIAVNQQQSGMDFQQETFNREAGWKKEDDDRGRKTAIELIREEEEARMEMLENQKDMEREALEARHEVEREAFNRRRELERADLEARKAALQQEFEAKQENERAMFEQQQRRMQMELETLRATLPRTTEEMLAQKAQIEAIYAQYGIQLTITGDQWAQIIGNSLTHRVNEARNIMSNDQAWKDFGMRVSEGVSRGAFNMSSPEFNEFIRTGNMPGLPAPRHTGGPVASRYDKYSSRGGIPANAPLQSSERIILAKNNEFMLNERAHRTYGTDNLNALNAGRAMIVRHDGGPIGADNIGALGGAVQAAMWGALTSRATLATGRAMADAQSRRSYSSGGGAQDDIGPSRGDNSFIESMMRVRDKVAPSLSMTSGWRFTDSGYHSRGMAADFSDGSSQTPAMVKFANYIADHYASQTLQLIHHPFGRNIGQGVGFVGDGMGFYGAGTMAGHNNHVHWAVNSPVDAAAGPSPFAGVRASGTVNAATGQGGTDYSKMFPQYADWTTAGIEKYRQAMISRFAPRSDEGAITGDWVSGNKDFYVREIVDEAKRRGLTKKAARIALMTAMQESGIRILANPAVPESFNFPHDGVGYDHDSVGIFQQRQAGWGTLAQRMNARGSAGLFYNRLAQFDYNSMDDGAAAQKVQVSAFPGAYSKWFGQADSLANQYFDMGGLAFGRGFMPKNIVKPERVLNPEQTDAFEELVPILRHKFVRNGIIGYDDIVGMLKNDNLMLDAAKTAIGAIGEIARDVVNQLDIKFEFNAPIYGVDDLESRLNEFGDELINKIQQAEYTKKRRLGGK